MQLQSFCRGMKCVWTHQLINNECVTLIIGDTVPEGRKDGYDIGDDTDQKEVISFQSEEKHTT